MRLPILVGACVLAFVPLSNRSASAQGFNDPSPATVAAVDPGPAAAAKPVAKVAKPYFIEFRSRSAQSYGHTFSIYGKLNAQGKIASFTVAGLHPFTESPIPWMVGHLVLVPSETGASDGDREDQYVTARFRINLSEAEYQKTVAYIKTLQSEHPVWHAVLYNCNAFVGDIARFMGYRVPGSTMLMPEDFISGIREANINRTDAQNYIGTPTKVEDANALRAAALKLIEQKKMMASRAPAAHPQGTATAAVAAHPVVRKKTAKQVAPAATPVSATPADAAPAPTGPRAQAPARTSTALAGYATSSTPAQ